MGHPVLWTNDDITFGKYEEHKRQLDFLDRHGIPGVFFVIPGTGDTQLGNDVELMRLIEDSRKNGHEYIQHGFIHTAFESGVPELWMLDFSQPTREQFDTRRFEIEATHTLEGLVEMLENGRRVWRSAFGEDSAGYRPGWGAYCTNLYRALKVLGFDWVSSHISVKTSWLWNQLKFDLPAEFSEDAITAPHDRFGVREYPIAGDYAFRVPNHQPYIDQMADLALDEYAEYERRGDAMLIVSHWHGLQFPGEQQGHAKHETGTGYAVHEQIVTRIKEAGGEFINMEQLFEREQAVTSC